MCKCVCVYVERTRQQSGREHNIRKGNKNNLPIGMIYDKGSLGELVSGFSMTAGSKETVLPESGRQGRSSGELAATAEEVRHP
jgi:hypothetical protein